MVIAEDVATTAGFDIRACEAALTNGLKTVKVLVVVDREEEAGHIRTCE